MVGEAVLRQDAGAQVLVHVGAQGAGAVALALPPGGCELIDLQPREPVSDLQAVQSALHCLCRTMSARWAYCRGEIQ